MLEIGQNYEVIDLKYGRDCTHVYFLIEKCLYVYNGIDKNGSTLYYRCLDTSCGCKGKIYNGVFSRTNFYLAHSHPNHEDLAQYERTYNLLKHMVITDKRPVRDVYDDFLRKLSFEASGYLNWTKVRHTLLRIRREVMPACANLNTFIEYFENDSYADIYNCYGKIRGDPFYLGTVQDDIMIFGVLRMVTELESSFHMFVDATFGVTPFHAEQLLVVMAEIHQKPRPIAYAIMTSKKEIDYVAIMEFLRDALISYDGTLRVPITVMCDFEKGMRNSFKKVWPDVVVNGCLFHFVRALRHKARDIKALSTKIRRGTIHHQTLLMFSRVALLPLNQIEKGLAALKNYIASSVVLRNDFEQFIKYFDSTWMSRYKKEEWCISACSRRTNNNVEGHNKFIKQKIAQSPSPWVFIDGLIDLVLDSLSSLAAERNNHIRTDRSKITSALKANLIELKAERINELEFLKRMI